MTFFYRRFHTCRIFRLYTYNMYIRIQHFGKSCNSCTKTATAYRYEYIVYSRKFFDYFHGNASLSCSHCQVIERMYKGCSALFSVLHSLCGGLIKNIPVKFHICTVVFCSVYLYKWCCGRHKHRSLDSCKFCGICHSLCMITCGCRYNSFFLFFFR